MVKKLAIYPDPTSAWGHGSQEGERFQGIWWSSKEEPGYKKKKKKKEDMSTI